MTKIKRMTLTTISALLLTALMATPCSAMDLLGVKVPSAGSSSSSSSRNCYVGCTPGVKKGCAVACGNDMHNGRHALFNSGKTRIAAGPLSWDECARIMRNIGMPGW